MISVISTKCSCSELRHKGAAIRLPEGKASSLGVPRRLGLSERIIARGNNIPDLVSDILPDRPICVQLNEPLSSSQRLFIYP